MQSSYASENSGREACSVYIIASTNRTGSYLLCEGLSATHIAGKPTESLYPEYYDKLCLPIYGHEVDLTEAIQVLIRHDNTPNGVFGAKVHWDQVESIACLSGYEGPSHTFLLKEFPSARYIYLTRRDTLAQAVSLSIAQQTGKWWLLKGEDPSRWHTAKPVFDAEKILALEQDLIRQNQAWEEFFQTEEIKPLRMEYETLVKNYRGEVGRTLDFLGLDPQIAQTIPDPQLQKQGTELNKQWLDLLRAPVKHAA